MSKPIILTGLRANGEFHLGSYLGAILPVIDIQSRHSGEYQVNMFIPDLHSFTTPVDHGSLYKQTIENLKIFIAAGLNIENPDTYIYRQSYIPAHSELAWILSCFTYFGELSRMTQFKDKSAQLRDEKPEVSSKDRSDNENVSAGLFNYPVLMAADILLYGAEYIPLGEDQRQHLELTRDIAGRINNKFGDVFIVPHDWDSQVKFMYRDSGTRIRSFRNPLKKMSKSIDDPTGTITLSDAPEDAVKKIMAAETDSIGKIDFNWSTQPGISNLLQILALLTHRKQEDVNKEWFGKTSYGDLKLQVADLVKTFLMDLQSHVSQINEDQVFSKLKQDESAINIVANQTLLKVQRHVGLRP